jgi:hypothetical protein
MSGLAGTVVPALPLLLIAATIVAVAILAARAVRDETVVEGLRVELRRVGETHRAVSEARARAAERRLRR